MARKPRGLSDLELELDGAQLHRRAALAILSALESLYEDAEPSPGRRLASLGPVAAHLDKDGCIGRIAAEHLPGSRPVRAIAFDKSPATNWALGWHQDRTVAMHRRAEVPGFGPWTIKSGVPHVEPPFPVIAGMVTLRIHLDHVGADNAPLKIALGSHAMGLVTKSRMGDTLARRQQLECLAQAGDIWAYRTAILHASDRSRSAARRRVLQVDYCAAELPEPLEWALETGAA